MEKSKILKRGMVLGIFVLFIGASATPIIGYRDVIDPDLSFVELTGTGPLVSCPSHDGPIYEYLKVTCKNSAGSPFIGLPASSFLITVTPVGTDTHWYGTLHVIVTAVDQVTNANGEMRFNITSYSSLYGNVSIQATVLGITINDIETLNCKTPDYDTNGAINLGDFTIFGADYGRPVWRSDFTGDGPVALGDFTIFGAHFGH